MTAIFGRTWRGARKAARQQPGLAVRVGVLALTLVLAAFSGYPRTALVAWGALAAGAAVATAAELRGPRAAACGRALEAAVWAIAVHAGGSGGVAGGAEGAALLPYLVGPLFAAGADGGMVGLALTGSIAVGGLAVAGDARRDLDLTSAEWVTVAVLVGLIAARLRLLEERAAVASSSPYAEVYRLLSRLHSVTRQLPGSLDPVAIAERLLDLVTDVVRCERAAVFVRTGGDRLVPLVYRGGGERLDWDSSLRADTLIADAWASRVSQTGDCTLPGSAGHPVYGSALVVPIRIGVKTFGVVALDTRELEAYPARVVREVERIVDETALRLATGLLFDEVREVATAEERRRLAREIHDGIAQELASIGYLVDALTAHAREEGAVAVADELGGLRELITRLVSEVRLSIFELRTDVDRYGGLGAALSEYVRTVGTSSALTVHLTLDEASRRLPAETEAALLRIAQEAVNNARRHAGAENLWVTCRVDPPLARLTVEDDGRGRSASGTGSYGMEIMRERAARLHARLTVSDRRPRGTRIDVTVGPVRSATGQQRAAAVPHESPDGRSARRGMARAAARFENGNAGGNRANNSAAG